MNKLVLIAATCIAAVVPLWSSSVVRLDFTQLSRRADRVVAGKIVTITSQADPATGLIYSRVTLAVENAIPAGLSGKPYEFRITGGEYGGRKLWIADFPELRTGQEVVLFLERETSGIFGPTVGLWQGVYFVERDSASGVEHVLDSMRRPVVGIRGGDTVLGFKQSRSGLQAPTSAPPRFGIQEFMEQVLAARSAIAGGRLSRH